MPMGIQKQHLPGTERDYVPGIPSLDTRFVEIGKEIHECIILKQYAEWDQEAVANGAQAIDWWKTEQNKNDLQHFFTEPHALVEAGKIAEVQYLKVEAVGARLGEMDARSLIQGAVFTIKNGNVGDEVFRDKLEYCTGGRTFQVHPDFIFAAGPSVFFGDRSYIDQKTLFKSLAFKGGSTFYPRATWPGNAALTATKTLELRVEMLELAPLVFLTDQTKTKGAA
ncbi:MAG: hypothetical protein PHC52_00620 [Syntrophales bacterium]|nr:hypothetical protein [Syntrophales bacterium]